MSLVLAPLAWAVLVGLLLREAPRSAWPVALAGSAGLLAAGVAVATWKLLVGVPAIAVAVTAGHPVRMLDPKWRMPSDEVTDEDEALADRYAFRAVVAAARSAAPLVVTIGL